MLTNKLPGKGTNIFTLMSKMAQEHDAINLAQGFPDFDGPPALLERVDWRITARSALNRIWNLPPA